jgi:hypothetical protein
MLSLMVFAQVQLALLSALAVLAVLAVYSLWRYSVDISPSFSVVVC